MAHLWLMTLHVLSRAAEWLGARDPSGVPRAVWAALIVAAAYVVGRIGGGLLANAIRLALLAAAVVVAWDVLHAVP